MLRRILAGPDFQYRVQVRPQIPHIGQVRIDADHVNLTPGEAKTIRVMFDREEDYRGAVTVVAESLPPGVSAAVGADFEPDKDPPLDDGQTRAIHASNGTSRRRTDSECRCGSCCAAAQGASGSASAGGRQTRRSSCRPRQFIVMVIEKP